MSKFGNQTFSETFSVAFDMSRPQQSSQQKSKGKESEKRERLLLQHSFKNQNWRLEIRRNQVFTNLTVKDIFKNFGKEANAIRQLEG